MHALMNMYDRAFSSMTALVVALAIGACSGEKKQPAGDPGGSQSSSAGSLTASDKDEVGGDAAQSDPALLGLWKVVEATGNYADVNKGMKWEFLPDGVAIAHSLRVNPDLQARVTAAEDPPDAGVPVEHYWSWKMIRPGRIEMKHPDSPRIADINYAIEGDRMRFDWLSGSQRFVMQRVAE